MFVIRGDLNFNFITRQDLNKVLPHLTAQVAQNDVLHTLNLDPKRRIGETFQNLTH